MSHHRTIAIYIALLTILSGALASAAPRQPELAVRLDDGKLVYTKDAQGNRIPDFSLAGYASGANPIPDAPIRVVVSPVPGDNTAKIQTAIDFVATLPPDNHGIRGAVLLLKGKYEIAGGILLNKSGVVLRGQGMDDNGTLLVATGQDRRTLITIKGTDDRKFDNAPANITDPYVPVGSYTFHIANAAEFKPGDTIIIRRPSTADWIKAVQMNDTGGGIGLGWKPNTRDIEWDRTITKITDSEITIDAPITTALESTYGGATVTKYTWPGRISQVGVENLACESAYDTSNPKDEAHSWMAVTPRKRA
jgi:hypothetical protein